MSKKATITGEMILNAALEITRREGAECVNARSIAGELGCTTQPVLYHFSTVREIKEAVYRRADELHTAYVTDVRGRYDHPLLEIGMQYVRFAVEERNLFRLLFQSNQFASKGFGDLLDDEGLTPLIRVMASAAGLGESKVRDVFAGLFFPVHGIASLIANNAMVFDEAYVAGILTHLYEALAQTL